ncbi:MAG: hypothetical protein V1859_04480 [archaeon]
MTKKNAAKKGSRKISALLLLLITAIAFAVIFPSFSSADPTGAGITYKTNSTKNATAATYRNDSKGTITTIVLDAIQQDNKWKAYVGNISSTFTLDDSADYTIYQWTVDSFTGRVFATRSATTPTWGNVNCSTQTQKETEDTTLSHNSTKSDSINRTFTSRVHKQFYVGGTLIENSSCFSIATWVSDTTNTLTETTTFQEVLLHDGTRMIWTTFVEADRQGYRNDSTYDFQMIVAENGIIANPNSAYYFYVELE